MRIETKFIPATDTSGEYIEVKNSNGASIKVPFDYATIDAHQKAAEKLAEVPVRKVHATSRGYVWETE